MKFVNFRHHKHNLNGKLRYFTKVAFGAGKRKSRGISDKSRKIVINRDRVKLTSLHIVDLVQAALDERCHPALHRFFRTTDAGDVTGDCVARIGVGRKRFKIHGALVHNQWTVMQA